MTGGELALRHGFVFVPPSLDVSRVSQGDVYFAIAAVLHHMRSGERLKSPLRQTEYRRRVISPLSFDRFNDGVIQAALLRAAVRPELDFSASPEESHHMTSVVRSVLASAASPKGEASREFLLALALERLVLSPADLRAIREEFASRETDGFSRLLWRRLEMLDEQLVGTARQEHEAAGAAAIGALHGPPNGSI